VVLYLLKIREEIKKLASGHISHRTALRLEKMPLFANFLKKLVETDPSPARRPDPDDAAPVDFAGRPNSGGGRRRIG
jgi:hypothetical protein